MFKLKIKAVTAAATVALAAFSTAPAHAAGVADFYKDRTVTIMVGFGAGGGYALMPAYWRSIWVATFPAIPISSCNS